MNANSKQDWASYENAKVIAEQRGYKVTLLVANSGWRVRIENETTLDTQGFSMEGFAAWAKKS